MRPARPHPDAAPVDFLVIGAMKCGTTSLHRYLDSHPGLGLAAEKEVNFFFGAEPGGAGNWWRGLDWYRDRFPDAVQRRGEVSPGYTSPDHPGVAARIARTAPDVQLLYLVRDPLDRAVSQYRHHRRDGAEPRTLAEAITDPDSHYVQRSRYADRLASFLEHFPAERIGVIEHEDLLHRTAGTVAATCRFLGVDPPVATDELDQRHNRSTTPRPHVPRAVAERFHTLVHDDAERFARLRRELAPITPEDHGADATAGVPSRAGR